MSERTPPADGPRPRRHRGRRAGGRRRALRGQARRRRPRRGRGRLLRRRPRHARVCCLRWRREDEAELARGADDRARQRSLARRVLGRRDPAAIGTRSRRGSTTSCRGGTTSRAASIPRTCASRRRSARSLIAAAAARATGDDRARLAAWAAAAARRHERCRALRADAMDEDARRRRDAPSGPQPRRRRIRPSFRSSSTARARASALVRDVSALVRRRARHARHASRLRGAARRTSRRWASTSLYLPPIHPIGRERRKGRNNTLDADPDDVGSPWAIGAAEGGHKALHPELGTLEDFRRLVARARALGLEIALDIAFQCAPDHPVRARPSAVVPLAPRRHGPVRRESAQEVPGHLSRSTSSRPTGGTLWQELASVFEFWIGEGVRIFRVDNPHTKPFPFWEWAIERRSSASIRT